MKPWTIGITALAVSLLLVRADAVQAREGKTGARAVPAEFVGYTGTRWAEDFGITRGRCDRKAIAAALGEASAAQPGAARVAVMSGTALDDADRACAAHALELARNHRTVRWTGSAGPVSLSTGGDKVVAGLPCRPFIVAQRGRKTLGTACQAQAGLWEVQK